MLAEATFSTWPAADSVRLLIGFTYALTVVYYALWRLVGDRLGHHIPATDLATDLATVLVTVLVTILLVGRRRRAHGLKLFRTIQYKPQQQFIIGKPFQHLANLGLHGNQLRTRSNFDQRPVKIEENTFIHVRRASLKSACPIG